MSKDVELRRLDAVGGYSPLLYSELLSAFQNDNFGKFNEIQEFLSVCSNAGRVNVNYVYADPYNGTLLHYACKKKYRSVVEILLKSGELDINVKDVDGNTALHIATELNDHKIIDAFFGLRSLDVNATNAEKQTPLHLALARGNEDTIHLLLTRINVDVDRQWNGKSCRDVIEERYADMTNDIINFNSLFNVLSAGYMEDFIKRARSNRCFLNDTNGELTYLQYACRWGLTDVVCKLVQDLELEVDPNKHHPHTDPPVVIAAFYARCEILRVLISSSRIYLGAIGGKNAVHSIFDGLMSKNAFSSNDDAFECLKLILYEASPESGLDVNYSNFDGNTILHRAIYLDDDKLVKMILNAPRISVIQINDRGEYALQLIKPSMLKEYLDGRIFSYQTLWIVFNYDSLLVSAVETNVDISCRGVQVNEGSFETDPLLKMSSVPELRHLLKHPVLTSLLHLKWHIIRKYFYMNLILYLAFWFVLTWYILYVYEFSNNIRNVTISDRNLIYERNVYENVTWLWTVTLIFCGVILIREIFQFSISPLKYLKSLENWLEMSLIAITGAILSCEISAGIHPQIATFAVLVSCSEAVLMIGRHPQLSTYIEMFKTVSKNFLYFLLWYSILILAFAFSFYILFNRNTEPGNKFFQNPWLSVLKSVIMMTGEFDAAAIPFDEQIVLSYLVFLLFMFLIAIVLFSLLNGLAVSDIQAIRTDAEIVGIISRLKLTQYLETTILAIGHVFPYFTVSAESEKKSRFRKVFSGVSLPGACAYVRLNRNNAVTFLHEILYRQRDVDDTFLGRFFNLRMDPDIVRAGKQILELRNSKQYEPNFGEIVEECVNQLKVYKAKLENVQDASQRNEKLLIECARQMQEYQSKLDSFGAVVLKSNEKLLMEIKKLKRRI